MVVFVGFDSVVGRGILVFLCVCAVLCWYVGGVLCCIVSSSFVVGMRCRGDVLCWGLWLGVFVCSCGVLMCQSKCFWSCVGCVLCGSGVVDEVEVALGVDVIVSVTHLC